MMNQNNKQRKRVVITGLGPVTPIGVGNRDFWQGLKTGRNGVTSLDKINDFPLFDHLRSPIVAAVPAGAFANTGGVKNRLMDMALTGYTLAIEDAGLNSGGFDHSQARKSVVLGTAVGETTAMEHSFLSMDVDGKLDQSRTPDTLIDEMCFHGMSHLMANLFGCNRQVLTISTGCTSGLDAIGTAAEYIQSGESDICICGGVEAPITPVVYAAFDALGALSKRADDPASASRPFSYGRDGFVLGEGAAILVLEELEFALARGAHIYGEIGGYHSLNNCFHMTDLPEKGTALADCMEICLERGELSPQQIDHVNAHGSSTPQNDICETNAIKAVLGEHAHDISVNSLKAMVGHALGASNAIEIAACALSLKYQFVFPTINLQRPDHGCDLDYVANVGRYQPMDHILKLSSGFSGIHSALTMSRYQ
ncbi:putative polyketide beta-ketoacyl synthase 1 [Shewanella hanedai]|uniref:Beta-ketoacyl-[acyl-carrier-protein] synthase family protein n=1 Tax=Shewanella hanedai TaxID=25 RepID=A0A553JNG7_SHEHA|nr:beta-ketoacyl-[acyl-carrier-protein] synthase family protein [Shewanella hanedai]TRY14005.1 beta-ketoacyl-[acyl-carrier-protein] synthase family protein [Shewanella hanedai]GGI85396.1 putative polyketide beta-ketoacyl synthase 1 [Shewanella hanedai]